MQLEKGGCEGSGVRRRVELEGEGVPGAGEDQGIECIFSEVWITCG